MKINIKMTGNYYNRKVFQMNTLPFRLTLISQQQWTSKKKTQIMELQKKRQKRWQPMGNKGL